MVLKGAMARAISFESVRAAFEAAGVEFIAENGSGPGVSLADRKGWR